VTDEIKFIKKRATIKQCHNIDNWWCWCWMWQDMDADTCQARDMELQHQAWLKALTAAAVTSYCYFYWINNYGTAHSPVVIPSSHHIMVKDIHKDMTDTIYKEKWMSWICLYENGKETRWCGAQYHWMQELSLTLVGIVPYLWKWLFPMLWQNQWYTHGMRTLPWMWVICNPIQCITLWIFPLICVSMCLP